MLVNLICSLQKRNSFYQWLNRLKIFYSLFLDKNLTLKFIILRKRIENRVVGEKIWTEAKDQWDEPRKPRNTPFYILSTFLYPRNKTPRLLCERWSWGILNRLFFEGWHDEIQGISISAGLLSFLQSLAPLFILHIFPRDSSRKSKARSRPRSNSDHLVASLSLFLFISIFEKRNNTRWKNVENRPRWRTKRKLGFASSTNLNHVIASTICALIFEIVFLFFFLLCFFAWKNCAREL